MAKKKVYTKKVLPWIKMPVSLLADNRVGELMADLGAGALGVYMSLILEMYRRPTPCMTVTQVKQFKLKGATGKTVQKVVGDYGLFRTDKGGHVYSVIDFRNLSSEADDDSDCKQIPTETESDSFPSPARTYREKEREKEEDYHLLDEGDGDVWRYIKEIPCSREWAETVMERSGFGELLRRNWPLCLRKFSEHVVANGKTGEVRSVKDAQKYFHYYVTNPTTGARLRQELEAHERGSASQNPYRFEDKSSQPGHRRCMGMTLPDDAPPRPDGRATWMNGKWTSISA